LGNDPLYGPWIEKQQALLTYDLEIAFKKYERKMYSKYHDDLKFRAMVDKVNGSALDLGDELSKDSGYKFEDNDGSLGQASNQWNTMSLWSVGMTASKTD
jgi:hypothetical protein